MLGWQDVKQRYKRSKVGPFWLTISMGVMIATIGLVFGNIFSSPMPDFLPFLTLGLILWGFICGSGTRLPPATFLAIDWPIDSAPRLSSKDELGKMLECAEVFL